MILLDTNVISAVMLQTPDPSVIAWLDRQPRTSIWTTSITVLELRVGVQILPAGKRRSTLMQALELLLDKIGHRVAPFDTEAAEHASDITAFRHKKGRSVEMRDTMIAGIAITQH